MTTEAKETDVAHLFLHKSVRNDDHCPICRKYYVTLHKNMTSALEAAKECLGEEDEYDTAEHLNRLKEGQAVWIDEWVRRSNGDLYQIVKPDLDTWLDLSQEQENSKEAHDVKYMMLEICIDKTEWCPKNIKFEASFHTTQEQARLMLPNDIYDLYQTVKQDISQLNESDTWWVKQDGVGCHYQILKLEVGKRICLNTYCPQLQPKMWFKHDK